MLGNVGQGRRDDDTAGILVIQRNGLLVFKGSRSPVVQGYVQLFLGLAGRLYHLLIGQTLVLVERQSLPDVHGSIEPLVAILALGILLQISTLHHLSLCHHSAKQEGSRY